MSAKKALLLILGWGFLSLPILSKALALPVPGLPAQGLFALCWLVGGPILVYAKFKLR